MRYFERAARLGSVRKAAQALYIAQPAVSRQIRSLEREIGSPLFDRTGHRVVLTTTGHRLLAHVQHVLDDIEMLEADMSYFVGRRRAQIRISVMSSVAECILPVVLPAFAANHPELDVVVERVDWPAVIEDVAEGRLDAVVANLPSLNRAVREEMLFADQLVVVLPPEHPWAGRRTVTLRELATQSLTSSARGVWFTDIIAPALRQAGVDLNLRFEISGCATIMDLVRAGIAVAFVTLSTADPSLPIAKVVEPEITRTLGWLEPAVRQAHPALAELKGAIRSHLEALRDAMAFTNTRIRTTDLS